MRKDERVTLLLLNQTGGIEKCDYQNMNRKIAPYRNGFVLMEFSVGGADVPCRLVRER